jgi:hypothetical protein
LTAQGQVQIITTEKEMQIQHMEQQMHNLQAVIETMKQEVRMYLRLAMLPHDLTEQVAPDYRRLLLSSSSAIHFESE